MKFLTFMFLISVFGCSPNKRQNEMRIKDFFKAVFIQKEGYNRMELENLLYFPNNESKEKYMKCYITIIDSMLNHFQHESNNNKELKVWSYSEYPEKKALDTIDFSPVKNIYVLKAGDSPDIYYFLIEKNKIKSFLTMKKGKLRFFITCDS